MHRHTSYRASSIRGCADGVARIHTCTCGAEQQRCDCRQCHEQETSTTAWTMPVCDACRLRHPADRACPAVAGMPPSGPSAS